MHDKEPRFLHISDIQKRPGFLVAWERHRHGSAHWFVECVAEFVSALSLDRLSLHCSPIVVSLKVGVFFYVFMGASIVTFDRRASSLT